MIMQTVTTMEILPNSFLTSKFVMLSSPHTWCKRFVLLLFFPVSIAFVCFVLFSVNAKILGVVIAVLIAAYSVYFIVYSLLVWDVYCDSKQVFLTRRQRFEQYPHDAILLFGLADTSSMQTHVIVFFDPSAQDPIKKRYFWTKKNWFCAPPPFHFYFRSKALENRANLEKQIKYRDVCAEVEKLRKIMEG